MNAAKAAVGLVIAGLAVTGASQPNENYVKVHSSHELDMYFDVATISWRGSTVNVWTLNNHKFPQFGFRLTYHSSRALLTIRCDDSSLQVRAQYYYSGRDGTGELIESDSSSDSKPFFPPPGTVGYSALALCAGGATAKPNNQ